MTRKSLSTWKGKVATVLQHSFCTTFKETFLLLYMVKTHIIDLTCLDTFFFVCINVRFCAIKVFMVEDAQNRCILSCWQHLFLNLLIEYQCHSPDVMNGIETHTFLKHVTCAALQ